jgi:hypothetical protein
MFQKNEFIEAKALMLKVRQDLTREFKMVPLRYDKASSFVFNFCVHFGYELFGCPKVIRPLPDR